LLFREATDRNTMTIPLPRDIKSVEAIAQNAKTEIAVNGNQLTATFAMPRSYAWFKIEKS
jgi:hypothetical protein